MMSKKEMYKRIDGMIKKFRALSSKKQRLYLDETMTKVIVEAKKSGDDLAGVFTDLKDLFERIYAARKQGGND